MLLPARLPRPRGVHTVLFPPKSQPRRFPTTQGSFTSAAFASTVPYRLEAPLILLLLGQLLSTLQKPLKCPFLSEACIDPKGLGMNCSVLLGPARLLVNSLGLLPAEHMTGGQQTLPALWDPDKPGTNSQFHTLLKSKASLKLSADPRGCGPLQPPVSSPWAVLFTQ